MTTPTGPIIAPPGQYTHCVDRTNYKAPPSTSSFGDILSALLSSSLAATAEWLLCDYLLGGKLVCLADGADECAIGVVVFSVHAHPPLSAAPFTSQHGVFRTGIRPESLGWRG